MLQRVKWAGVDDGRVALGRGASRLDMIDKRVAGPWALCALGAITRSDLKPGGCLAVSDVGADAAVGAASAAGGAEGPDSGTAVRARRKASSRLPKAF